MGVLMDCQLSVVQAVAGPEKTVYAHFSDGSVRLFDASPLVAKGGVFAPLEDWDVFAERLTVLNHTVAWDLAGNRDPFSRIDVDPYVVYRESLVVEDPLARVL